MTSSPSFRGTGSSQPAGVQPASSSNSGLSTGLSALIAAVVGIASFFFLPWPAACLAGGVTFLLGRLISNCGGGEDSSFREPSRTQSLVQSLVSSWRPDPSSPRRVIAVPPPPSHGILLQEPRRQQDDLRHVRFASPVAQSRPRVGGGHEMYAAPAPTRSGNRPIVGGDRGRFS